MENRGGYYEPVNIHIGKAAAYWDLNTSAILPVIDEDKWKQLEVPAKSGPPLPLVPGLNIDDKESINADPQLKWDGEKYPVGLKATPHPKVEGPQLDEKVNNMMPNTVYGLQSADPERAVRDPVPLPTSTGITSSKKHVAARIDGVKVDLGKPVDYGALIGPSRAVSKDRPQPPSMFEKPEISWSQNLDTTIPTYSITAAVPVESRGVEEWLPKKGNLTRLQEENPAAFAATTPDDDDVTEKKSTSPRGSSFLGGEDDDTEDIKNHIKATRALLTPNLKHTVGYWGDWMVSDLTKDVDELSKSDLQPLADLTDMERKKGDKGMMEQAEAVMKVLALLRPVVVETMTSQERGMKDVEEDIKKTVTQEKENYDELFEKDAAKFADIAQRNGKVLLTSTKKIYLNLMKSISVLIKKVYKLQRALLMVTARHAKHSTRILNELERTTRFFIARTDRADSTLRSFVTAGPERRKAIKTVMTQLGDYQKNIALKRFQRSASKMAGQSKRKVQATGHKAIRVLKVDDKDIRNRQKKSDRAFNARLRLLRQRRETITRDTLRDFGTADRHFSDEAGSDSVSKWPLVNDLLKAAEHQASAVDELGSEMHGIVEGAEGPHKLLGDSLKENERNMEARIEQETEEMKRDTSREATQVNADLKDLQMAAQNAAGRERTLGMAKVKEVERQEAAVEEAEKSQLDNADITRGQSEAEMKSDIGLAATQADGKLNNMADTVKSREEAEGRLVEAQAVEADERQGKMKQALSEGQTQRVAALDADMGAIAETNKEEYQRMQEQLKLEGNDEKKGVNATSSLVSGTADAVHNSEEQMGALHDEMSAANAKAQQGLDNALKDLDHLSSGGSAGLDHLQADETHDLTNSVQEVAEAAHKDVAEARSDTKSRLQAALGEMHAQIGGMLGNEQEMDNTLIALSSDAAKAQTRAREIAHEKAAEHDEILGYLSKSYKQNRDDMSKLPSEIEAKGKKQLTNAKKLLSDEMQNRNKAIAAVAAEHIMAIGDLMKSVMDLLTKGEMQEEAKRRLLAEAESKMVDIERSKTKLQSLMGASGNETSGESGSMKRARGMMGDTQMELLHRREEMKQRLKKGLVFLDHHISDAHDFLQLHLRDLEKALRIMIEQFRKLLNGEAVTFAKSDQEDSAGTAKKLGGVETGLEKDMNRNKVRLESILNVDKESTMDFTTLLSKLTAQAQGLGLSGNEMKSYIEEQLSKLSSDTAGEVGVVGQEVENEMTGFRATANAERDKAKEEIAKNDKVLAHGEEGVYGQLDGLGQKVSGEATEVGNSLGYNAIALRNVQRLADGERQTSSNDLKALIHTVSATKDSVMREMAESHGADLNALGRVEDVVAIVDTLTKSAFDEIQGLIGSSTGDFQSLDEMLDTLGSSTNSSVASLNKDVEEDVRKSDKFMNGIRPILAQMKEDASGYEKKDREIAAESISARKSVMKAVSDTSKEGDEVRAQAWKNVMR
ncbi:Cingulin, putative [Perkinsus marinus ATCC 50983]|uniref:Cingulin, putative n=1 Tax=Perkinsus marinus (strain ATCC 50983 / TXsc) TaxID=423536 RepID=C5KUG3_PERM5|nr:Cingulin, putative [Perkinsus marinus ATCC 50983]EER11850.1 Cingulin, putative [Perkinsus marinus ATCC 50983]|eukprot:XP_002780055.1 Cingulin, putative [Perkinsus marinus ATCC 50983]